MYEAEAALDACLPIFGRLPGAAVIDEGDLRLIASGRGDGALNHIAATRLEPERVAGRVADVRRELQASGSLPATWWITSTTSPADLAIRLEAAGLRPEEPEFGMVYRLAGGVPDVALPDGAALQVLAPSDGLGEWIDVMRAAYGWKNPAKVDAEVELYRVRPGEIPPWTHVLVTLNGRPAASGSLFTFGGHAFVTNIGTIPEARGLGLGSVATAATLSIARRQGFGSASLTASVMGRSMYARLGFREECQLDRLTLSA
jgi:hypothetical protein